MVLLLRGNDYHGYAGLTVDDVVDMYVSPQSSGQSRFIGLDEWTLRNHVISPVIFTVAAKNETGFEPKFIHLSATPISILSTTHPSYS